MFCISIERCCCALHEASQGWQVDYFFCSYAAGVSGCVFFPTLRNPTWYLTVTWWILNTTNQICQSLINGNIQKYRNIWLLWAYRRFWLLLAVAVVRTVILLLLRLTHFPQVSISHPMFVLAGEFHRVNQGWGQLQSWVWLPKFCGLCLDVIRVFWKNGPGLSQLKRMGRTLSQAELGLTQRQAEKLLIFCSSKPP